MEDIRRKVYGLNDHVVTEALRKQYGEERFLLNDNGQFLTKEQEEELCWFRDHGIAAEKAFARKRLCMSVFRLIGSLADVNDHYRINIHNMKVYDIDDVHQAGYQAFMECVDNFDPEKGRLSTFVQSRIPFMMIHFCQENRNDYRISSAELLLHSKALKVVEKYRSFKMNATPEIVAEETGMSVKQAQRAMTPIVEGTHMNWSFMNYETTEFFTVSIEECEEDVCNMFSHTASRFDTEKIIADKQTMREIKRILYTVLSPEQVKIFMMYYIDKMSTEEIVNVLGWNVSTKRIWDIANQSKRKLANSEFFVNLARSCGFGDLSGRKYRRKKTA